MMDDNEWSCRQMHEPTCTGKRDDEVSAPTYLAGNPHGDAWMIDAHVDPAAMGQTPISTPPRSLFPLGEAFITSGAVDRATGYGVEPTALLARHARGDWGDIDPDDRGLNEQALRDGSRILSVYTLAPGAKTDTALWIITDAADDMGDRAATTILTPADY